MSCGDIFLGVLAILFPPIAVWIKRGLCSCDSLLNILLCLLGYIPGLIHAWYIIARYPDPEYERLSAAADDDGGESRVTYYYVSRDGGAEQAHAAAVASPPGVAGQPDGGRAHRELQRGGSSYGTITAGAQRSGGALGAGGSAGEGSLQQSQQQQQQQQQGETPPTYAEAVKGDHKAQAS